MERNFVSLPENEGHFRGHNLSFAMMYKKLIIFFFPDATTHCAFVFCSPLAGYSLLAYQVS